MNGGGGELDKLTQDADRKRVASSSFIGARPPRRWVHDLWPYLPTMARLPSYLTRFYKNTTTSSTSSHIGWNCATNSTNLIRKLARTSTILRRTKPITLSSSSYSFRQPQTSTQVSLRRFSTSRTFHQRKYVRFQVDPEAPLDYRRWNPGTQVAVGLSWVLHIMSTSTSTIELQ